jgi:hypothetical protein
MLINLPPDQTVNLNYPVGVSVLYNVNSSSECSSAQMGLVKAVSMHLGIRELLYVIEDNEGNNVNAKQYFLEHELAFAPDSPVTIDVKIGEEMQKFEGEVLSCLKSDEKKIYSIMVKLEMNNIRMFHAVPEKCKRHRRIVNEESEQQHTEASLGNDVPNEMQKDMLEVQEVEVRDVVKQKENLCSISDGSTARSKDILPITQETKSDSDEDGDSSSVPSSNNSSDEESVCDKITMGMLTKPKQVGRETTVQSHLATRVTRKSSRGLDQTQMEGVVLKEISTIASQTAALMKRYHANIGQSNESATGVNRQLLLLRMITAHPTENVLTQAASKAIEWKMRDVKKSAGLS